MGARYICLGRMLPGIAIENQGTAFAFAPHARGRPCLCFGVGLAGTWELRIRSVTNGDGRPADQATRHRECSLQHCLACCPRLHFWGIGELNSVDMPLGVGKCPSASHPLNHSQHVNMPRRAEIEGPTSLRHQNQSPFPSPAVCFPPHMPCSKLLHQRQHPPAPSAVQHHARRLAHVRQEEDRLQHGAYARPRCPATPCHSLQLAM